MTGTFHPFHFLVIALAGWLNRHQQDVIDYLLTENRILKAQLNGHRLQLTDDQRRRLAVRAKKLGRTCLREIATLVTPDTLLRWHRLLVARKWTYAHKEPGRPSIGKEIEALVVRMARENQDWGYVRIQGALANLGYAVSSTTVANVLKRYGIEPAPGRRKHTTWSTFIKAHWELLAATDFFTVEVWTMRGLVTYYVLFTIHLATRRVCVAGITTSPNGAFMIQVARQLTDELYGALTDVRFLIMDRDTKFTKHFKAFLRREGIEPVTYPPRSPNCSPYAERFVRSIKTECLNRIVPIGVRSLRRAINEYVVHYHGERNHQGLDNQLISAPVADIREREGPIHRRERLGGMLSHYYRLAA